MWYLVQLRIFSSSVFHGIEKEEKKFAMIILILIKVFLGFFLKKLYFVGSYDCRLLSASHGIITMVIDRTTAFNWCKETLLQMLLLCCCSLDPTLLLICFNDQGLKWWSHESHKPQGMCSVVPFFVDFPGICIWRYYDRFGLARSFYKSVLSKSIRESTRHIKVISIAFY